MKHPADKVVVVGVDGSDGSRAALDFGLEEGLARGATVEVVTAWLWTSSYAEADQSPGMEEAQKGATTLQDEIVDAALARMTQQPSVSRTTVHEYGGKALVELAESALMLVVGSGRKGVLTRVVLGSVSEYCVRHSPVPVVVVPDPRRVAHAPEASLAGPGTSQRS